MEFKKLYRKIESDPKDKEAFIRFVHLTRRLNIDRKYIFNLSNIVPVEFCHDAGLCPLKTYTKGSDKFDISNKIHLNEAPSLSGWRISHRLGNIVCSYRRNFFGFPEDVNCREKCGYCDRLLLDLFTNKGLLKTKIRKSRSYKKHVYKLRKDKYLEVYGDDSNLEVYRVKKR